MEEILTKLDAFLQWNFSASAQGKINVCILWFGYAYLIGLITSFIPRIKWPRNQLSVIVVGFTGCTIGGLAVSTWRNIENYNPLSPAGLIISILTAVLALILYRVAATFLALRDSTKKE